MLRAAIFIKGSVRKAKTHPQHALNEISEDGEEDLWDPETSFQIELHVETFFKKCIWKS